ncbi:DNA cytosine methyltransferase [Candidatus Bathyarchaeota archaeon]|nr:DNA cytosine methyltransferase [Candidatus Bathyarchaeota archaeon]
MCAGYGGIGLGLKNIFGERMRTLAYCELEGFAQANLISKMEKGLMDVAPLWNDLKTFPYESFHGLVDILIAGYPCQPFSAAGKRAGKEDPRHLWPWIADGIRLLRPRMCFFENVEGHISLGLREVVGELESMGYKVSWGIFSAREVRAPHQRKRVFIMAHLKCAGLEGLYKWHTSSEQTELVGADSRSSGQCSTWPSRPGQPQYGWEPPRVVGDTKERGCAKSRSNELQAGIDATPWNSSGKTGEAMGNSTTEGLQGCGTSSEMDDQSRGAEGEGSESTPSIALSSDARGREVVANSVIVGRGRGSDGDAGGLRGEIQVEGSCGSGREAMGNAKHIGLPTEQILRGNETSSDEWRQEESKRTGQLERADRPINVPSIQGCSSGVESVGNAESKQGTPRDHRGESGSLSQQEQVESGGGDCGALRENNGQVEPSLGGDIDGSSDRLDYAELQVSCDNRTDELRLLGNGVVPATAERAFRTLLEELITK